uniref:Uncharacterized protein n=1 Tax=Setaria viridis TaxID=4556 RepID=A0A4U6V2U3_SETVI|nr:hypothetical protein SEVIR_4G186201v2 [Setaria viridis]
MVPFIGYSMSSRKDGYKSGDCHSTDHRFTVVPAALRMQRLGGSML